MDARSAGFGRGMPCGVIAAFAQAWVSVVGVVSVFVRNWCTSPRQVQHFPNKRRSTNRTPSEVIPTPSPTGHQPAGRELRNPESP